jgi:hypothetical protein
MDRRQSGVAHVNIFWAIVPMVMMIGAGFYGYLGHTKAELEMERSAKAVSAEVAAKAKQRGLAQQLEALTGLVGQVGKFEPDGIATEAGAESSYTAPKNLLDYYGSIKGDLELSASGELKSIILEIKGLLKAKDTEIADLRARVETAQDSVAKHSRTIADITSSKDTEISRLEAEKRRAEQNTTTSIQAKEEELGQARNKTQVSREEARKAAESHSSSIAKKNKEIRGIRAANTNLSSKLELINSPSEPDGKIISASARIAEAYIDLGSKDMVKKGMVFRVLDLSAKLKAHATIMTVNRDRSLVKISGLVDSYNPVVKGDVIANDLYSKLLKRDIYLVGRFVQPFTKGQLTKMLESLGNTVHKEWNASCDLLIMGREPVGEDAVRIEDTEAYKTATDHRIEVAPLYKIQDFLKL